MPENFYEKETYDFYTTQGDTVNIKLRFFDQNNDIIDLTNWASKFTLKDPITGDPITALQKTHNDGVVGGDGIYYNGDTQAPVGIGITVDNELVIVLSYTETATLDKDIYPFDLEFTISGAYTSKFTAVHGNLILKREITASV